MRINTLPREVLISVFQHLHFLEKAECLGVSKSWHRLLKSGYLYEVIPPISDVALMVKSMNEAESRERCTCLILSGSSSKQIDITQLIMSCPNMCFLEIQIPVLYHPIIVAPAWKDCLETIIDKSSAESIIPKLLKYSVFTKLKVVSTCSLTGHYSELVPALKNAPNLVDLTLKVGDLSLLQFNELHNHTPQLTHLALGFQRNSRIHDDIHIDNIIPTDKLRTLKISNISTIPNRCLIPYAIAKYSNLIKFTYSNHSMNSMTNPVLKFIQYCGPKLVNLNVDIKQKSPEILDAIINCTPQVSNLSIRGHNDMDDVNKITHKENHHILQSISLKGLPVKFKFSDIQHLTFLSCLDLDFINIKICKTIPEHLLIGRLPKSIKSLALRNCQLSTAKKGTKGTSTLEKITLTNVKYINHNISPLLSHFTKLNTLIIDKCNIESTLSIPEHELETIEFIPVLYPRLYKHVNITTNQLVNVYKVPVQQSTKYYCNTQPVTKMDRKFYRGALKENDALVSDYMFQLTCKKVRNVCVCGCLLL